MAAAVRSMPTLARNDWMAGDWWGQERRCRHDHPAWDRSQIGEGSVTWPDRL